MWFEYLPNKDQPKDSRYRCRLCFKYFDSMKFSKGSKSTLAQKTGVLKGTKKKPRSNLRACEVSCSFEYNCKS